MTRRAPVPSHSLRPAPDSTGGTTMTDTPTSRVPARRRCAAVALLSLTLVPLACGSDPAPAPDAAATPAAPSTTDGSPTTTAAPPARLDLVAEDYDWTGLPDQLPAGTYPMTLRNDGAEIHEIQVFRNPEHLSLQQLFDLGPVEMAAHVEEAGGAFVGPGDTSEESVLELEPGTYEVVCFVPSSVDQQPHFDHGMHRTLEVR